MTPEELKQNVATLARTALAEDLGSGDLTSDLVDSNALNGATVIAREAIVVCGELWAEEVFRQLDDSIVVDWYVADGERADPGDVICKIVGPTRSILSGERTALNFLQTLSGTATVTRQYVDAIEGTEAQILDTRKTLPGMRLAQKHAVRCGGGANHRIGLFDAILIKENHIRSAGGVADALELAQAKHPDVLIEIEVENMQELKEALAAGAKRVLLDNFTVDELREAVRINEEYGIVGAELEASGGIGLDNVRAVAETGVDYISVGALTKHVHAADLSLLLKIG